MISRRRPRILPEAQRRFHTEGAASPARLNRTPANIKIGNLCRRIVFTFLLFGAAVGMRATGTNKLPFQPGEKIYYDIYYHWGLIWKLAGQGTLGVDKATYNGKDALKMYLNGTTLNFADKMMKVRDTLRLVTTPDMVPLYYTKIANEGKHWGQDVLHYQYDGNGNTKGKVSILRRTKPQYDTIIHVNGQAFDMLSVFYHLRMINYSKLKMYEVLTIPIFTGKKQVKMRVKYMGRTIVKLRSKKEYPSYRLNLSFVNDDNLKDDDPIEVWLSDDAQRIPLKIEGKLPIGSLQAEYRD